MNLMSLRASRFLLVCGGCRVGKSRAIESIRLVSRPSELFSEAEVRVQLSPSRALPLILA